ncbi:DUF3187 family protein [Mesoterricola sediminis]|uniref:DUF3187 family protein n=1 Tax=Mesoterricola sediminis TaxID=2927980 RepID=A0AA48H9G5_9BACT|nr:DUF3187 family protein [Mesoterricola sediminis]BDU78373.1 hypothetical protein METESE_33310 [Mesoterricola sediminis]
MRSLLALALGLSLQAQAPLEPGPLPTRNMFTLLQAPMTYQPLDPRPTGRGAWQFSLTHVESNVFEFSDLIKDHPPAWLNGRVTLDRARLEALGAAYPQASFLFWFDEQISRTTLQVRHGLTDRTDVFLELPVERHGGGGLDGPIEAFHGAFGFGQWGREEVARDQAVVATFRNGKLDFLRLGPSATRLQDPVLGLVHQLRASERGGLSATLAVKPPLANAYGTFRAGWDVAAGFSGWWRPTPGQTVYAGAAWTFRGRGNAAYDRLDYRPDLGAHLTWEGRRGRAVQPFLQLYFLSGFSTPRPFAKLHEGSLQHDLGVHVHLSPRAFLTLRYINNITHHENTDDASFAAGVTVKI